MLDSYVGYPGYNSKEGPALLSLRLLFNNYYLVKTTMKQTGSHMNGLLELRPILKTRNLSRTKLKRNRDVSGTPTHLIATQCSHVFYPMKKLSNSFKVSIFSTLSNTMSKKLF